MPSTKLFKMILDDFNDEEEEEMAIAFICELLTKRRTVRHQGSISGHAYIWHDRIQEKYMRSPNKDDIARLLRGNEVRGFPGMLGSIDCMHWKWKNCPAAWKCMYVRHVHEKTIIFEAIATHDLWIWHAFFGLPESHNDINVLERSFLFTDLIEGHAPPANYSINGHDYAMAY
ncbi:hypothetical protein FEM48_Zijuj11G0048600 [Ziziphus jujuba var. spinosa]|uniref:Nuclease HARBI1 n=1 Tax=Ziziphus jujuba var. spinosa TaxID=714518 RepID=A0A978UGY1_ZIZJJ|nr:hypothetical protein FEM48_Zijuj11G0048600 [Ziziphus jujuba var. spinosa]